MAGVEPPLTATERAQRSVFVGNIPYDASEEQLRDIFAQVGPVASFRLVYDRETGKPKGYGFCEYQDLETAQSAMRNLNNYDFSGRPLRVGVAAGEQNKDDMKAMQQAVGGPVVESPYGEPVEVEKAPEAISKAVASLPPEQMYELMKQMKLCIQNNPNEARNMLLQNPQLAYALLQAQIVMKIVDPQVALAMLYRQSDQIPPLLPTAEPKQEPMEDGPPAGGPFIPGLGGPSPAPPAPSPGLMANKFPGGRPGPGGLGPGGPAPGFRPDHRSEERDIPPPPPPGGRPAGILGHMPNEIGRPDPRGSPMDMPDRMDPRGMPPRGPLLESRDPRSGPAMGPRPMMDLRGGPGPMDPRGGPGMDPRGGPGPMEPRGGPGMDPRGGSGPLDPRGGPGMEPRGGPGPMEPRGGPLDPRGPMEPRAGPGMDPRGMGGDRAESAERRDPRGVPPVDPRGPPKDPRAGPGTVPGGDPRRGPGGPPQKPVAPSPPVVPGGAVGAAAAGQDKEKAALIMQVLQLTDQQIAMLPEDQRQSILILKEQISRSGVPK